MIRIALPNKGSLSEESVALCKEAGYRCKRYGRELSFLDPEADVEFFFLRPRDIAVYVGRGVLDAGIPGRDLNADADQPAHEALARGFGRSTFRYAVPRDSDLTPEALGGKRVAADAEHLDFARRDDGAQLAQQRRSMHDASRLICFFLISIYHPYSSFKMSFTEGVIF